MLHRRTSTRILPDVTQNILDHSEHPCCHCPGGEGEHSSPGFPEIFEVQDLYNPHEIKRLIRCLFQMAIDWKPCVSGDHQNKCTKNHGKCLNINGKWWKMIGFHPHKIWKNHRFSPNHRCLQFNLICEDLSGRAGLAQESVLLSFWNGRW